MEQVRKASLESLLDFTNSLKAAHSNFIYIQSIGQNFSWKLNDNMIASLDKLT